MPDENYTVKINRRDGIVEITGPDKDWIAEQIERLAVVYEQDVPDAPSDEMNGSARDDDGGASTEPAKEEPKKTRRQRSGGRRLDGSRP